jgi:predicted transcriptional regulator
MTTAKQILHELADKLPEQATLDDAMYTLYVRQKVEEGLNDIAGGRVVSHEEVRRRLLG